MAIQVGFSPPPGTTIPTAIADGSNLPPGASVVRDAPRCRQAELGGKQMANHTPSTTKKNVPSTTRKFLAAGGLALSLGSLGLFASAGTAAAGSWPADPSWPAPPSWGSWPAPPSWGSHPADPSWPGTSSHPCCSR
jgi:hypothetical protein